MILSHVGMTASKIMAKNLPGTTKDGRWPWMFYGGCTSSTNTEFVMAISKQATSSSTRKIVQSLEILGRLSIFDDILSQRVHWEHGHLTTATSTLLDMMRLKFVPIRLYASVFAYATAGLENFMWT